jgi:hypothetical protein
MEVMVKHIIERNKEDPSDYKYCCKCGRINHFKNDSCITCKGTIFRPLNDDDAWELREEWENNLKRGMGV